LVPGGEYLCNPDALSLYGFLFCLISPLTVAQVYKVTDLGLLAPTAINNWGQVAGNLNGHAFIWTTRGSLDLGTLAGGTFSSAAAINDLAVVAGTADGPGTVISQDPSFPNQECSDLTQPFVWTPRNGMQGLGTVGGVWDRDYWCEVPFYATGINAPGLLVGYTPGAGSYVWAFFWTSADGMTLFGGSWPVTAANGVSNTGQIVGQNSTYQLFENGLGHATSWKSGVATDLGTLGGGADVLDYTSSANGVNDQGQVVGWSDTAPDYGVPPIHAVLWTASGAISDLGTLPGDTLSTASNIDFFGQVIGSSGNTLGSQGIFRVTVIGRPFIWSQRSGMQDLNTLISAKSGWVLNTVTGINFWGQIVGSGTLKGQAHGFLLTPRL